MSLSSIFLNTLTLIPPLPLPQPPQPFLSIQIRAKTNLTLQFLKPYLFSQHKPILCRWLCSALSIYSLSVLLSKLPTIATVSASIDAAPSSSRASPPATRSTRSSGRPRSAPSTISGSTSSKACPLATWRTESPPKPPTSPLPCTLFLTSTIVPSTLQLSAMMMQMLVLYPFFDFSHDCSLHGASFAFLGQELRKISKEAHDVGKAYNECRQGEPAAERLLAMSRPGETVAIVGPSGGGKTTLVKLLLPLYDPISGTVAENIGYRDLTTKFDMDRVKHASEIAHADKFGSIWKVGYCKGFLSKFFYVNSGRVSLDSKSELLVRQTVLVISYRLETVMMAKRVFLLDDGKLKELPQSTMLDGQKDSLLSSGLVI
ncbi:hypothetical protein JHK85_037120 [Glycine max]|nr:hypothetical protein JHK85_037120 [Glycine max]